MKNIFTRLAIWVVFLCSLCAFLVPTASAGEPWSFDQSPVGDSLIEVPAAEAVVDLAVLYAVLRGDQHL